jgi:hypothetical protein
VTDATPPGPPRPDDSDGTADRAAADRAADDQPAPAGRAASPAPVEAAGTDTAHDADRGADAPPAPAGRAAGLLARLARLRRLPPRAQAVAVVLAAVVLVAGSVVAARSLELTLADLRPAPLLLVALVLVPATILANTAELRVLGRLVGAPLPAREALRVVLVATAASFLPLPGAAVTRVAALTARGAGLGAATGANLLAALVWVGGGTLVAAGAAAGLGAGVALPLAAVGIVAGGVGIVGARRLTGGSAGNLARLAGVELATVALHAARLWLVAAGLGRGMTIAQALVTGANGPLAAAAGVVPSGIGLAEGLGAALGATVELAAAAAFAATAANRVLGVIATVPVALVVGIAGLRAGSADDGGGNDEGPGDPNGGSGSARSSSLDGTVGSAVDEDGPAGAAVDEVAGSSERGTSGRGPGPDEA